MLLPSVRPAAARREWSKLTELPPCPQTWGNAVNSCSLSTFDRRSRRSPAADVGVEIGLSLAVLRDFAVEQSDEGLARGSRLNGAAGNDFTCADGFVVEPLVGVIVRIKGGIPQ